MSMNTKCVISVVGQRTTNIRQRRTTEVDTTHRMYNRASGWTTSKAANVMRLHKQETPEKLSEQEEIVRRSINPSIHGEYKIHIYWKRRREQPKRCSVA